MPGLEPNSNTDSKPCRTCTDFKSWTKIQTTKFNRNAAGEEATGHGDKVMTQDLQKFSTRSYDVCLSDFNDNCVFDVYKLSCCSTTYELQLIVTLLHQLILAVELW